MSLYEQWTALTEGKTDKTAHDSFWSGYFESEKQNYASILSKNVKIIKGKFSDVAKEYNMEPVIFTGFIDGISTSLVEQVDIDALNEETELNMEIDYEKLYHNMLNAKADWLYDLPEWDGILDEEKRSEITKAYRTSKIAISDKIGRNDPCTCGSGKKYKKCCGNKG